MNISIEKKIFIEAVHTAARFADRKSATLPALSAVLILAGDDGIKMRATNLETGIDLKVPGDARTEGVAAIPAPILQQVASSLSGEGKVDIEHTGDTVVVKSGHARSSIKTVSYEDFPSIPFPEANKTTITVPGAVLRTLFANIAPIASTSTIRPELASLYVSMEGGTMTVVATDSFRLAEKKVPLPSKGAQGTFLIPAKNALDIAQALPDEDVEIIFDEHQCAFSGKQQLLVSRLTNAAYPDYRQIIPKEFSVEATVLRKDFEAGLKQTAVFTDSFQKIKLSIEPEKKQIQFFAHNADIGEATEVITAQIDGDGCELSFNQRYLGAALGLTTTESIKLQAVGVGRPLIIRGLGDESLLYLVSPMNQ